MGDAAFTVRTPGLPLDVKTVRFADKWLLFAAQLRLRFTWTIAANGGFGRLMAVAGLASIGEDSNEAALQNYTRLFSATPSSVCSECRQLGAGELPARGSGSGATIPAQRLSPRAQLGAVLCEHDTQVHMPVLAPPGYISQRSTPAALERFLDAVRRFLREYLPGRGLTAVVPYFSNDDPEVRVVVDSAGGDFTGIIPFVQDADGSWVGTKLLYDTARHGRNQTVMAFPIS
jgi:hypothetical protein